MKKTFFLNFNQKNRDSFLIEFSNSLTEKVSILDVGSGSSPYRSLSRKSPILILFLILSLPFLIPFIFLLFLFRMILDKSLDDSKYTVGYHIVAVKNK